MTTHEPEPDPDRPVGPIPGPLPSDAELEAQDPPDELDVPEDAFLSASDASADETVDDAERDELDDDDEPA